MKKTIGMMIIMVTLAAFLALGQEEDVFAQVEDMIQNKIPCAELNDTQLEIIGDYYMEQMHPGAWHEWMDQRLGGEGSAQLQQVHLALAQSFYCGERQLLSVDMMNTMMGRTGMMGGMMTMMGYNYGMMGSFGYGYWGLLGILYVLLVLGLIVLVYLWALKLWRSMS